MNPSKDWTDQERLILIWEAANRISQELQNQPPDRSALYDYAEAIRFLASASSAFLEANRYTIIKYATGKDAIHM